MDGTRGAVRASSGGWGWGNSLPRAALSLAPRIVALRVGVGGWQKTETGKLCKTPQLRCSVVDCGSKGAQPLLLLLRSNPDQRGTYDPKNPKSHPLANF